eukprot:COSAG03_NODE_4496_length_1531_cov_8.043994_1_plen_109_part_00
MVARLEPLCAARGRAGVGQSSINAATIEWSHGLRTSKLVQTITRNVLARLSARAACVEHAIPAVLPPSPPPPTPNLGCNQYDCTLRRDRVAIREYYYLVPSLEKSTRT